MNAILNAATRLLVGVTGKDFNGCNWYDGIQGDAVEELKTALTESKKKILTQSEENVIKDVLQVLACDPKTTEIIRRRHAMLSKKDFEKTLESIYQKLQNGRVTVYVDEMIQLPKQG
jgi:hypothetical protein